MRKFWKAVSIALIIVTYGSFITMISMFWWPSIPPAPRPAEGRVFALNDHGRYTYMNKKEHDLQQSLFASFLVGAGFVILIQYFADPFDCKRQYRVIRPAPPWEQMK
jgi:hypothetical protein